MNEHDLAQLYLPLRERMIVAGCWPTRGPSILKFCNPDPTDSESFEVWLWSVDEDHYRGVDPPDALNTLRCAAEDALGGILGLDSCWRVQDATHRGGEVRLRCWTMTEEAGTFDGPTIHHALTRALDKLLSP